MNKFIAFLKKLRIYFYSSIAVGYLTIFAIFYPAEAPSRLQTT